MSSKNPKRTPVKSLGTGTIPQANTGTEGRHVTIWRPAGDMVSKLTPDQVDHALERIAGGDSPSAVAKSLGVTVMAFNSRENSDPEFAKAYQAALAASAEADLSEAKAALIEKEDARKLMDYAMWKAEKLEKRYAAKSLISAESITISLTRGVDDAWDSEEDQ